MTPDWSPLDTELAEWKASGLTLPLWWRDDDAIAPTDPLVRLADLTTRLGLPVHLAVIPADAGAALAEFTRTRRSLIPVIHGFAHRNHAPADEKKAEFGAHRPMSECLADAKAGLARMSEMFGQQLMPMFVPPWNRIAPDVVQGLAALGYEALSTFTPRQAPLATGGLVQINTHLDPIHWRGNRSLLPHEDLIAQVARELKDRRTGTTDNTEPYGILTHHLVHDKAIWQFTEALISRLLDGPADPWVLAINKDNDE